MELKGRWWNAHRDRTTRRDIWLTSDGRRWSVRARHGSDGDPEVAYLFEREYEARAMVDRLMSTAPGAWKDLIRLLPRDSSPAP